MNGMGCYKDLHATQHTQGVQPGRRLRKGVVGLGHAVFASLERDRALRGATGNVIYLMYSTRRFFCRYLISGRGLRAARASECVMCRACDVALVRRRVGRCAASDRCAP
ncbi:hypothetical protein MRX96_029037 [Rhipicephalus microplus]